MEVLNTQENIFLISKLAQLVKENPNSESYILENIYKDDVNILLNKIVISDNLKTHWICWAKFSDIIEVGINKHIKQVLLQKFKPNSQIVKMARLKNSYSPKFFEILQQLPIKITPEDLKQKLNIVDKYERYYDFKKKVIIPSLIDLEKIDMSISFKEIKDGKKVVELIFTKGEKMSVDEMKIGQSGIIKKITATEPFKSRLFSLGIVKGEKLRLLKHTLIKNTYEIEVNKSKIALRKEEAKMIIVEVNNENN